MFVRKSFFFILFIVLGASGCDYCLVGQKCGSGSSGSSSSGSSASSSSTPTPSGSLTSTGGGGYIDTSTGAVLTPEAGGQLVNTTSGHVLQPTGGGGYIDTSTGRYIPANSIGSVTKDVDLQKAEVEEGELNSRARIVADHFDMSFESAVKVTRLSDKIGALTRDGRAMTAADQAAVIDQVSQIAGVKSADIATAIQKALLTGDAKSMDVVMDEAAKNLGMPSSAALRDEVLPALGMNR